MTKLALAFALFVFSFGCSSDIGSICQEEKDCGGSTICAHDVACGTGDCVGVCSDPCDTVEDCSGTERCLFEPGTGRGYCQRFEEPVTRD